MDQHFEYYLIGSHEGTTIFDQTRAPSGRESLLASYLAPLQALLGGYILELRTLRRFLNWQDRILTTGIVFGLLALAVALALIPWGWVLEVLLRVVGFAIFGPHM